MKYLLSYILPAILIFAGFSQCGQTTPTARTTYAQDANAAQSKRAEMPSAADRIIEEYLRAIHSDLKELKPEFPQLSSVDGAGVEDGSENHEQVTVYAFEYTNNFIPARSKNKPPTIGKYGCHIVIKVQYPVTADEMNMVAWVGRLIPLRNGRSYGLWMALTAEDGPQARRFKEKAGQIINARLRQMHDRLDHLAN